MSNNTTTPLSSSKSGPLKGRITVPGDKSISHRALIFTAMAIGTSKIIGLLEGEDVIATANALRALGADIKKEKDAWVVKGVGVGGLRESADVLNQENSGTGVRLLMGLVSSYDFTTIFTGDASLRSRPMA